MIKQIRTHTLIQSPDLILKCKVEKKFSPEKLRVYLMIAAPCLVDQLNLLGRFSRGLFCT